MQDIREDNSSLIKSKISKKKKKTLSERNQNLKLPNLKSAYLKPPEGTRSTLGYLLNSYNPV